MAKAELRLSQLVRQLSLLAPEARREALRKTFNSSQLKA